MRSGWTRKTSNVHNNYLFECFIIMGIVCGHCQCPFHKLISYNNCLTIVFITPILYSDTNTGSFLVMVMKLVSLGFDLDVRKDKKGEKVPPKISVVPSFVSYSCYCFFPSTCIFGPFVTYTEHSKYLTKSPLVSFNIVHILHVPIVAVIY